MVEEDVQPLNAVLLAAMKGRRSAMVVPAVLFVQKKYESDQKPDP
jgi:hypothetical protein